MSIIFHLFVVVSGSQIFEIIFQIFQIIFQFLLFFLFPTSTLPETNIAPKNDGFQ